MWANSSLPFALALLALLMPVSVHAENHVDDDKRQRICANAEKRYQKLFGKSSGDENVAIIMMHKHTFCPREVTVKKGDIVRWVNVDKRTSHSVWFKQAGEDESTRLFGEEQIEKTFDGSAGEYPYLCGPHWEQEGMIGKVIVQP